MTEILTYHTKNNGEDMAVKEIMNDPILNKLNDDGISNIVSIAILPDIRNYIMIEVLDKDLFVNTCRGNKYIRSMVKGRVGLEEITRHVDVLEDFKVGDKVSIIQGALKGSKGKVVGVDKREATIILDDSAVMIPVRIDKGGLRREGSSQPHKPINPVDPNSMIENKGACGNVAKQMGIMKKMNCYNCGHELEYLYIPSHKGLEIDQTGSRIFRCEVNAKIIGDDICPECGKKLAKMFRKEEDGARVLQAVRKEELEKPEKTGEPVSVVAELEVVG